MRLDVLRETITEYLHSVRLTRQEIESLDQKARDRAYWIGLNPDLSIGANWDRTAIEERPLELPELRDQIDKLSNEGYFQAGPILKATVVERMCAALEKLRAEGWPPVFSFVYDEFWSIVRTPSLLSIASAFLGPEYGQNASIWAYYIAPQKGARGWPPHVDSKNGLSCLTIWVPLSDATLDNGCMYLIPHNRVPASLPSDFQSYETVKQEELTHLLHGVKALPARKGSFLGWHHKVIHWGSYASEGTDPRVSIFIEFEVKAAQGKSSLFATDALPSFDARLQVIANRILEYQRFEPSMLRFEELAGRLAGLGG